MTQIIIATHGLLASGLKESAEFILGKKSNLHAICAYTKDCPDIKIGVNKILKQYPKETLIFLTDVYGGSVNNYLEKLASPEDGKYLICGVNLPCVIQLFNSLTNKGVSESISDSIEAARKGVMNCSEIIRDKNNDFDSF